MASKLIDVLKESFERNVSDPERIVKLAKADAADRTSLSQHFDLQNALRPLFGKGDAVPPSFGDHPDYAHLRGTSRQQYGAITTLFLDMEGSTKLSLILSPPDVFKIKNAIIQVAIDIVRAFDGHVHRIMGDAVMCFFGGVSTSPQDAAVDALNCACSIRALMSRLLEDRFPELENDKFAVRIGIDHGSQDSVLWASYGYPGMQEVTATSFFVDVASKLQHSAGRNQIMIGESMRRLLDIPAEVLEYKTTIRDGNEECEPYLMPNYLGKDRRPINYRKHIVNWEEYLKCTPLQDELDGVTRPLVHVGVSREENGPIERAYRPVSNVLSKHRHLRFSVDLLYKYRRPVNVVFAVENHGDEASAAKDLGHEEKYELVDDEPVVHWEETLYKGLHYLSVVICSQRRVVSRRRVGVWVS